MHPNSDPARLSKWALLVSSVLSIVFLAAAAIRENVAAEWKGVQREYKTILLAKSADAVARRRAEAFSIEIRQVTVPALKVVDRCVSCHNGIEDGRMADQSQPHRTHSQELLKWHPVAKFGCTTCHQGQGLALTFNDAKGEEAFWDYPLLPAALTEATCATCHDPRALSRGSAAKLVRGMELFDVKGCASCHKIEGKGGSLGPALDNVGLKTKHQFMRAHLGGSQTTWNWHSEHLRDPGGLVPGTKMPSVGLTAAEREALTVYILSLRKRDLPEAYLANDKIEEKYAKLHPAAPKGEALYAKYCSHCHDTGLYARWSKNFKRFIPAIRNQAFLRLEDDECLAENILEGRPGTEMPGWGPKAGGLREAEIQVIVEYLRGETKFTALPPAPARGSAERGHRLFTMNCAGCHGVGGKNGFAPALANAVFQKAATDAFIAETIRNGRGNTPMPSFGRAGLGQQEIGDLLAYIRSLAQPVRQARSYGRAPERDQVAGSEER
ncbi:MAG: c-type cytochrome [Acidobacteria bacterium]|nr:c-type cytochrome [Acidobacteriota bacterium]